MNANVTKAVTALATAVADGPSPLQGASQTALAPVLLAAQTALNTISGVIQANDPSLDSASPDGQDPAIMAAWLNQMACCETEQATLSDAFGYASRIALNLELANG